MENNDRKNHTGKIEIWASVLLFAVFFAWGICIFRDYGLEPDDPVERDSSVITFNSIFPYSCSGEACPRGQSLETYADRYYGTFLQQWTVLIEYLRHYQLDLRTVYWIRHLWVFLNVFLSQILFFFLLKKRFSSVWAGLFGVLLFIFSPRLLANSFYNIKDLLFYAWFVISLFCLMRLLEHPGWQNALLLGIVCAVSINTRIIGGIVPVFALAFLFQDGIQRKISWKESAVSAIVLCLSSGLGWFIITPMAWRNPIDCIAETFALFSNFPRKMDFLLPYAGHYYKASALPWHYLPVWIAISIPVLNLLLAGWGIISYLHPVSKKNWNSNDQIDFTCIFMLVLMIAYVMIRRPVLYDGWRHLYFLFALIIYACVYGMERLIRKKNRILNVFLGACCIFSFVVTGIWMAQNHPYEGTYFNPLFRSWGLHNCERDYWLLSTKECMQFILKESPADQIRIWDDGTNIQLVNFSLGPADRSRLSSINYGAGGVPADYLFSSSYRNLDDKRTYPFYRSIYCADMEGVCLSTVFERDHTDELQPYDVIREIRSNVNPDQTGAIFDSDRTTGWTTGRPQQAGDYLEIYLDKNYDLYGISAFWEKQDGGFAHSLAIDISNDGGKTWQPTELTTANRTDFAFNPIPGNALRLRLTADNEYPWYMNYLWIYGK